MTGNGSPPSLRSARWLAGTDLPALMHRAALRGVGLGPGGTDSRPLIGICNSFSEVVHCNTHLRGLAQAVKRGVVEAGGLPLEFPTISLGEDLMKPTAMLYRNLMAMDVEESLRAYPFDAVVLLAGCDKTVPAQLMGAASADVPAIMLGSGPARAGTFRGESMSSGASLWRRVDEYRRGELSVDDLDELEGALKASVGHCNEMGTASTMLAVAEGLGMSLPGSSTVLATDQRRVGLAEATGARAVELARQDVRPRQIMTAEAFDNAIRVLMALGGSTNAPIHLIAMAQRARVPLTLQRLETVGSEVPWLVNVQPSGEHLVVDFDRAGGVPALMRELSPLLDHSVVTVAGPLADVPQPSAPPDRSVIASLAEPLQREASIAVLTGNLAPAGALIKRSAATPSLLRHRGPAIVFDGMADLMARIDSGDIDARPDSVLVLRGAGPRGGPGMPEWGALPIPSRLLRSGITDLVRISDARMSGTASGTIVLHVAPEGAVGGPIAAVRDGDEILLDHSTRRLELCVAQSEMESRLRDFKAPARPYRRGYGALYLDHVLGADQGCDLDFLLPVDEEPEEETIGMFSGWIGGW